MSEATTYRSGRKKGLPIYCECGGRLLYEFAFGRIFNVCDNCSPVIETKLSDWQPHLKRGEQP